MTRADETTPYRSGFIALIGRPNVGKSTLLNALVGQKLSIVTAKPQTTRNRIVGVRHFEGGQMVLLDTPGIHEAQSALNEWMVRQALATLEEADGVVLLIDAQRATEASDAATLEMIAEVKTPVILALNKIDLIDKPRLLPLIDAWRARRDFHAIVPISALRGIGLQDLGTEMEGLLGPGPEYFPADMVTDQPMRFVAAEVIREKLTERVHAEIPYSVAVVVDQYLEEGRITRIHTTIYVERDSQKRIVVGKGGEVLRDVGTAARRELEWMTGTKVHLTTWVKVLKNWAHRADLLARVGYGERS